MPHLRRHGGQGTEDHGLRIQDRGEHQVRRHRPGRLVQDHRLHQIRRKDPGRLFQGRWISERQRLSAGCEFPYGRIHQGRRQDSGFVFQGNRICQEGRTHPGFVLQDHRLRQGHTAPLGGILFFLQEIDVRSQRCGRRERRPRDSALRQDSGSNLRWRSSLHCR